MLNIWRIINRRSSSAPDLAFQAPWPPARSSPRRGQALTGTGAPSSPVTVSAPPPRIAGPGVAKSEGIYILVRWRSKPGGKWVPTSHCHSSESSPTARFVIRACEDEKLSLVFCFASSRSDFSGNFPANPDQAETTCVNTEVPYPRPGLSPTP